MVNVIGSHMGNMGLIHVETKMSHWWCQEGHLKILSMLQKKSQFTSKLTHTIQSDSAQY